MPGNARPHIAEASRPTPRRGTGPQRRVPSFLGAGETRQPPSGATPNRRTTTLLAESAGRRLEPVGNGGPRGMTVIARLTARRNRTRLIGGLRFCFDGRKFRAPLTFFNTAQAGAARTILSSGCPPPKARGGPSL